MKAHYLTPVNLDITDVTVTGFDCGERWNGFIVPLFRGSQRDELIKLLCNEDYEEYFAPYFVIAEYRAADTHERLYMIEAGFCFMLSE